MIHKMTPLVICLALVAGLFGVLPAGATLDEALTLYAEPFDTAGDWTSVDGSSVTAYGIREYNNPSHPEVVFHAEVALRDSQADQDGFPGRRSEPYAWRLRDINGTFWQARITTGGVGSFSVWVRRWDGDPDPNYTVEYSTNNGDSWITVETINNVWLDHSSNWRQVSGTINTSNGASAADDIIIRIRRVGGERLLVDDFEMTDYPLAVTLASFTAEPQADHILVSWETVSEFDTAGFNLYRSEDVAGPLALLATVPSQAPGSTQGAVYNFEDMDVQPGQAYWYWLEDISLSGTTTLHGPVSATVQASTAVTLNSVTASPAVATGAALPWLIVVAGAGAALGAARLKRRG